MHVLLWNPCIRESKKLLEFVDLECRSLLIVSGLCCYVSSSTTGDDDYKVIIGIKTSSDDKYSDFDGPKVMSLISQADNNIIIVGKKVASPIAFL